MEDVIGQKYRTSDILVGSRRLSRTPSLTDSPELNERLEKLKNTTESLVELANQRLDCLENAFPLAEQFVKLRSQFVVVADQLEQSLAEERTNEDLFAQQDRIKVSASLEF